MKKLMWTAAICLVLPFGLRAQMPMRGMSGEHGSDANLVSGAARQIVARYGKILTATAQEMPADKYSYHPTPAQMTFGQVIAHIANSNVFLCSKLSDVPAPKLNANASESKDKLVEAVKASFDYCTQSVDKLQDSQLADSITFYRGRPAKRVDALFGLTGDLHDHYAALAVYVRLNGLLPPTARRGKM